MAASALSKALRVRNAVLGPASILSRPSILGGLQNRKASGLAASRSNYMPLAK